MAGNSSIETFLTEDMDVDSSARASASPGPTATSSPVLRGNQCKSKQRSDSSAHSSTPDMEDAKQAKVAVKAHKRGKGSGRGGAEFQTSVKILKQLLLEGEEEEDGDDDDGQMNVQSTLNSSDTSQVASDESLLTTEGDSSLKEKVDEGNEGVNMPRKRKPGCPPKQAARSNQKEGGTTRRKGQDCNFAMDEEADDIEESVSCMPKKRKPGRPPKKPMQGKDDADTAVPLKRRKVDSNIARLPGTKLKICSHCGTVADKVKAKKCFQCKKFFFSHWAQRCKIPPCPSCHFSRKCRRFERVPTNCEKCGVKLPSDILDEVIGTNATVEDGDGAESLESGSTSIRYTPDPSELDNISAEGKQTGEKGLDEYLDADEEDEEKIEEVITEKKRGKGKGKAKCDREKEETESSPEMEETQNVGTVSIQEGATVVVATTRSGRAYKHDTTPERTDGTLAASSFTTRMISICSRRKSVQDDTLPPAIHEMTSSSPDAMPMSPREQGACTDPPSVKESVSSTDLISPQQPDGAQDTDHSFEEQEDIPQAVMKELSDSGSLEISVHGICNVPTQHHDPIVTGDTAITHPTSPAQALPQVSLEESEKSETSCDSFAGGHQHPPVINNAAGIQSLSPDKKVGITQQSAVPERDDLQQSPMPGEEETVEHNVLETEFEQSCGILVDRETQVAPCVNPPNTKVASTATTNSDLCTKEGSKDTTNVQTECKVVDMQSVIVSSDDIRRVDSETSVGDLCIVTESSNTFVSDAMEGDRAIPSTTSMQSSAVQTMSGKDIMDNTIREGNFEGDLSMFSNINKSVPFLRTVLGSTITQQDIAQSIPAMSFRHVATSTTTVPACGSQSLPVLYTANLGLEDANMSRVQLLTVPGESSLTGVPASSCSDEVSIVEVNAATNTQPSPVTHAVVSAVGNITHAVVDNTEDMVVTESGTLATPVRAEGSQSGITDSMKHSQQTSMPKPSKGKKAVGKSGKPLATPRKKKQPKSQEATEGASKEKQVKPRKPRAKKSKTMTTPAPSVGDESANAALSMLATSIAQELQRKPSLSSPLVEGQHSKHSFSQYFYSEDSRITSATLPSILGSSGSSSVETSVDAIGEASMGTVGKGNAKCSPSRQKDLQEPPVKRKKLANIAPNNPLVSTSSTAVSAIGPQALKATLAPLMTPALLPHLYQLASTFKMSSSSLISLLQSVLPAQKSNSSSSVSVAGTSTTLCTTQSPVSLTSNFFPPLTMSFQSLTAALPSITAPIRLSGTQVTARPLLPSTMSSSLTSSSATVPSTTIPLSLPAMFSSSSSISSEQLATLKGVLGQSEASVGTQTALKKDTLKSLLPTGASPLSPQLLSLPNPPHLTSSSSLPPPPPPLPPPSLVPKDLKPTFQALLSNQLPYAPPPLTSSLSTPHTSPIHRLSTASSAALPLPIINPNTATSYDTLPVSTETMFTSLPFLSTHSGGVPLPGRSIAPPQMAPTGDTTVQPLLISCLPEPQPLPISIASLLPPPPHLLPQTHPPSLSSPFNLISSQPYAPDPATSSQQNPIIPSLLRPGMSPVSIPEQCSVSGSMPTGSLSISSQHPLNQQKVIYTQSITSPKVCTGPQPAASIGTSVDTNLQVHAVDDVHCMYPLSFNCHLVCFRTFLVSKHLCLFSFLSSVLFNYSCIWYYVGLICTHFYQTNKAFVFPSCPTASLTHSAFTCILYYVVIQLLSTCACRCLHPTCSLVSTKHCPR